MRDTVVKNHPMPMNSTPGLTQNTTKAPRIHRVKLFEAIIAAELFGNKSTKSVLMAQNVEDEVYATNINR